MRLNNYKSILLVLALSLLTGCNISVSDYVSDLISNASDFVSEAAESVSDYIEENSVTEPHEYTVNMFNEVFELVQEKDTQAIFDMFSEYAKENVDMMHDIEKLVEFMDGEITEIRQIGASNDYMSVRDGKTISAAYSATANIKTNTGMAYWFDVGVITADDNETKLGLDWIYVLDSKAFDAYTHEWGEWNERRINGAKEDEPQRPEDMEVGVNY